MTQTITTQQARLLNGASVSNSVVLQGALLGVLLQHTSACDMKVQASFDNNVWWDVTTITGSLGAPIADATDRKFLTTPEPISIPGTLLRILATVSVTAQTDCWIVTAND